MKFSQIFENIRQTDDLNCQFQIPETWMQGRTTYGGLTVALSLKAAETCFSDLPPLRSASVNFTGPVGGEVTARCTLLRQGKSVSYLQVDVEGQRGHAAQTVFSFGKARESRLSKVYLETPDLPGIDQSNPFFEEPWHGPIFARNFDVLLAKGGRPVSGSNEHEHFLWIRHQDKNALDLAALIGIADMPPPAVLPMFTEPAPISSMTWALNFLQEDISTEDGWWLMRTCAEHANQGYSSQDMQVWNTEGELVISGRQNVALFY